MSSIKEKADQKCPRCKSYKYPSQFVNAKGRTLKSCSDCRARGKKNRDKNKCEHDKSLEDWNIRDKYKMGHIQNTNYKVATVNFRISLEVMKKDVTRLCRNIGLIKKKMF